VVIRQSRCTQVCSKLEKTFISFYLSLYSNFSYDAAEFLHQQDCGSHLEVYSVLCLGIKICSCMLGFSHVPSVLDVILIAVRTEFFCHVAYICGKWLRSYHVVWESFLCLGMGNAFHIYDNDLCDV